MPDKNVTRILNVPDLGRSLQWFRASGRKRGFTWDGGGMIGSCDDALANSEHGPARFSSVCSREFDTFLCRGAQESRGTINPQPAGDDRTDSVRCHAGWIHHRKPTAFFDRLFERPDRDIPAD